ncbi:phosphoenolpyruvate carboxykinase (ATP) [Halovenus aranensis]|uniref:phosphoenolpyruvate carboxykinase (ATP) n=1 Tax=Halovenus aranensis TaxID=890420 RepID=A0A1G8XRH0_9EURY|nr:phosphoenolpyruvate carboxykinase (ATP) [Halovenus aranensis]SDJ92495.1 phosphoenolpyruvate carboxykinase (ATP) [Halovenus aranensis]
MSQRVETSRLRGEFPDPETAPNVVYNPTFDQLRAFADGDETTTEYGSPRYVSEQKSRSADRTKNLVDDEFSEADWNAIEDSLTALDDREFVCLDRQVGRHQETAFTCRLFVPREYARIALAWGKLLEPAEGEPDFQTLQLPEWDEREDNERRIRVLPDAGLTFVLGSDYTGEAKKSFLRLFMYYAKEQGGLGIHAGSKRVTIEDDGELETVGQAFLGLSATGKSTLTGHGCWLDEPEGAEMLQDDVCALLPDGQVTGSEGGGLYIKTDGLDRDEQPALYDAATHESAVFENVWVDDDTVDFDNTSLTSNGRAVIQRDQLDSAAEDIDLEGVDQVFFITRNPMMPPIARLDDRQAAVAFMLGESIQTSAGDPNAAGESIRVVGTNPFIIGPEGEEGNRFRDLIAENDVECFVINTGHIGPAKADIGVRESVNILVAAARGDIEWEYDERMDLELPSEVPGISIDAFYPPKHYDDFDRKLHDLREERLDYLQQFETLRDDIVNAVY